MAQELVWKDDWEDSDVKNWLDVLVRKVDHETYMHFYDTYTDLDSVLYDMNEGEEFCNDAGEDISADEVVDELNDVVWRIFNLASK